MIRREARIESAAELLTSAKKDTRDWEASKMVCRHVKAIVKPRVMITRRRSCRRNSFLKFWPPIKNL